jgi:uncharacterized protein YeaO (DUF488 family)
LGKIRRTHIANLRNIRFPTEAESKPNARIVGYPLIVTRSGEHKKTSRYRAWFGLHSSCLAPSWDLLNEWKSGKITWEEFEQKFRGQINKDLDAIRFLRKLLLLSKKVKEDIYLVCYCKGFPCHTYILLDILEKMGAEVVKDG